MNDEINRLLDELKFKGMAGVIDQQVAFAYSKEFGHPFQSYSAACSDLIRPVSPTEFGHPTTGLYEG